MPIDHIHLLDCQFHGGAAALLRTSAETSDRLWAAIAMRDGGGKFVVLDSEHWRHAINLDHLALLHVITAEDPPTTEEDLSDSVLEIHLAARSDAVHLPISGDSSTLQSLFLDLARLPAPPPTIELGTADGVVLLRTDDLCMLTAPLAKLTAQQL